MLAESDDDEVRSADGSISGDEIGITVTSMVLLDRANNLKVPFSTRGRMNETEFQSSEHNFISGLARFGCGCRFI